MFCILRILNPGRFSGVFLNKNGILQNLLCIVVFFLDQFLNNLQIILQECKAFFTLLFFASTAVVD